GGAQALDAMMAWRQHSVREARQGAFLCAMQYDSANHHCPISESYFKLGKGATSPKSNL
ncbi:hypothetical protein HAX54_016572, partial [Datura stramonium]|nr:hypothetical protein [Datura stramonium]